MAEIDGAQVKRAVATMVDEVRKSADDGDDETAHRKCDAAWLTALTFIAAGCDDPAAVATEALGTLEIDFHAWYA